MRTTPRTRSARTRTVRAPPRAGATASRGTVFGARTSWAIRRFQSAHSPDADGIVGPRTWEKPLTG
ncbi:peptidoglycan-binding domain-containing protein [Streptomyces nojiriensis]